MKKILFVLLMMAVPLFGQNFVIEYPGGTNLALKDTLTNTEYQHYYIIFPTFRTNEYYFGKTLPTDALIGSATKKYTNNGDFYLNCEINASSGQKDSVGFWIKPLIYDPVDSEYAVIESDSTFLVLDTKDDYTDTEADYLDFVDGTEYACLLTGELWPCAGFVLCVHQKDAGTAVSVIDMWYSFTRENW